MATTGLDFSSQVDAWCKKSQKRMLAVFRESTQRTVNIAQDRIPVDTGFARASVRASLQSMPMIDSSVGKKGTSYSYDGGTISATIAGAELSNPIYVGWTANYVGFLEHGHSKQAPSGFVRLAAMQWPQTVSQVVQEAKGRTA